MKILEYVKDGNLGNSIKKLKPLPFRGWRKKYLPFKVTEDKKVTGNYYVSSNWEKIIKMLKIINSKMPHIKQVIIDDFQYVLSYEFVDRATEVG